MSEKQVKKLNRRLKRYLQSLWHVYKGFNRSINRNVLIHLLVWQLMINMVIGSMAGIVWYLIANHIGSVTQYLAFGQLYQRFGWGLIGLNWLNLQWLLFKRTLSLQVPKWWVIAIAIGFLLAQLFSGWLWVILNMTMLLSTMALIGFPDAHLDTSLNAQFGPPPDKQSHYIIKDLDPHDDQNKHHS